MLIVGYCFGIRSERRLCEEVHLNLAYRWFCRLGLDGDVPDHSTFSKNRHGRFRDSDLLRKVFETVVRRCMAEGLVGGEGFAVDASLIKADANKQRSAEASEDVDWEAMAATRRSVREYLDTLDEAAWGAASETRPKFISRSDPAAQWTGAHKGHAFFAYATNYLIDLDHAIIVDVEATRAIRQAEVGAARDDDRAHRRRASGSTRSGSPPTAPMARPRCSAGLSTSAGSSRTSRSSTSRREPTGHSNARTSPTITTGMSTSARPARCSPAPARWSMTARRLLYRASKYDCDPCTMKPRCCPKTPARKVPRSIHEGARDMARDIAKTEEGRTSRRLRKKVEMLFAHLKRILRLDRLRLRGPNGARDEFLLAATAQNLRKLAKLIPMPS